MRKILISTLILMALPLMCGRYTGMKACGPDYEPEVSRAWLFDPFVSLTPELAPFRYYYYSLAPGDPTITQEREVAELWASRLEGVKVQDVEYVLYKMKPADFLKWARSNKLAKSLPKNTFAKAVSQRPELVEYLIDAFESPIPINYSDNWFTEELGEFVNENTDVIEPTLAPAPKPAPNNGESLGQQCVEKARKATVPYLKFGYGYLACRNFRAAGKAEACLAAFEELLNNEDAKKNGGVIYNMGLRHYASALYKVGRVPESAIRFAELFDRTPSLKQTVSMALTKSELETGVAQFGTFDRREPLLALIEIKNVGRSLEGMKALLQSNPQSKYFTLLVSREINKLENWLYTTGFSGESPLMYYSADGESYWWYPNSYKELMKKLQTLELQYAWDVLKFIVSVSDNFPAEGNALHLAAAHLAFIVGDAPTAQTELAKVKNPKSNEAFAMAALLCMNDLFQPGDKLPQVEAKLVGHLKQAEVASKSTPSGNVVFGHLCNWIGRWYKNQGKEMEAGLLYFRSPIHAYQSQYGGHYQKIYYFDKFAKPEDLERLLVLLAKKDKTPFEAWMTEPIKEPNDYADLLGTVYMRQGDLQKADVAFSRIPDSYWDKVIEWEKNKYFRYVSDEDPFHQVDALKMGNGTWKFNKKGIVKKMLELEKIAQNDPAKRGEALFLLGNAWFNFTQHGNTWMMLSYGWSNVPLARDDVMRDGYSIFEAITKEGMDLSRASKYYNDLLSVDVDRETRAGAIYMLAVIKRIKHDSEPRPDDQAADALDAPFVNPWLQLLEKDYMDTDLVKSVGCDF